MLRRAFNILGLFSTLLFGSMFIATAQDVSPSVDAIYAYYDAINRHDCVAAEKIRPKYSKEKCLKVKQVVSRAASSIQRTPNFDILFLDVKFEKVGSAQASSFDGFVTMKRYGKRWVILSSSLRSKDNMSVDAYIEFVRREYDILRQNGQPPKKTASNEVIVLSKNKKGIKAKSIDALMVEAEAFKKRKENQNNAGLTQENLVSVTLPRFKGGTDSKMWRDGGPRTFGSNKILKSCWPNQASLRGRRSEKKTRKTGRGAYMKRPQRAKPKRSLARLPARYRRSIRHVDTNGKKLVALTFDTGERNNDYAGYDAEIVNYLRKYRIKATFYFGGKWMATHPERAAQIIADPLFEPGNHAWTHGNMRVLKGKAMRDQFLFTQAQYELVLEDLWSRDCVQRISQREFFRIPQQIPTFRYPYGTCSNESLKAVNDAGLPAVQWDVVSADPVRAQSAKAISRGVLRTVKPGSIVVMHANGRGWNTGKALPILIPALKKKGYKFVTVSEMLRAGKPIVTNTCYELRPGDNARYDRIFGRGTGD